MVTHSAISIGTTGCAGHLPAVTRHAEHLPAVTGRAEHSPAITGRAGHSLDHAECEEQLLDVANHAQASRKILGCDQLCRPFNPTDLIQRIELASTATLNDGIQKQPNKNFIPETCNPIALDALKDIDRLVSWAEAKRHELIVAAVGTQARNLASTTPGSVRSVSDIRALELGAVLGVSPTAARNLAAKSRTMVLDLSLVQDALSCGRINPYKAHIIHDGAQQLRLKFANANVELRPSVINRYQRLVLAKAHTQTASELRRKVNLTVARLAPLASQQTNRLAREERSITLTPAPDDMAYLTAYLPAQDASRVWQVLSHAARHDVEGTGSTENRMADALVSIVDGSSELSPENRSQSAEIHIAVSLADIREAAECNSDSPLVGEIVSTGMTVSGDVLNDLLADSRFRRMLFDDQTGNLLDFGRTTYRPPQNLRSFIQTRDRTCRAPGCVRIARYCDLDHINPWESGGVTSADNLAALCRTHHLMKTHGGWKYEIDSRGNAHWVLPGDLRTSRLSDSIYQREQDGHQTISSPEDSADDPPF